MSNTLLRLSFAINAFLMCIHILSMERPGLEGEEQRKTKKPRQNLIGSEIVAKLAEANKALLEAAEAGDTEKAFQALADKADVNTRDVDGGTPLCIAAANGHEALAILLLEKGATIGARAGHGETPLHMAVRHGNAAVISLLLENGNIEAADEDGRTPLHIAANEGREIIVRLLLDRGANIEATSKDESLTPLHVATWRGVEAVVRLLLDRNANIETWAYEGSTPLNSAFELGKDAVARLLIMYGATACVHQISWALTNALHHAAASGSLQKLETSLKSNALLNDIQEALMYATGRGYAAVVNRLLAAGADPHAAWALVQTIERRTWLQPEARKRYDAVRRSLFSRLSLFEQITRNPDIRIREIVRRHLFGFPPEMRARAANPQEILFAALEQNNLDGIREALDAGAHPHAQDQAGRVPIEIAAHHKDLEQAAAMVKLLIEREAFPNPIVDFQTGRTLLMDMSNRPAIVALITAELQHHGILGTPPRADETPIPGKNIPLEEPDISR